MIASIVASVMAFIAGLLAYVFRINRQNDRVIVENSVLTVQKKEAEVKLEATTKTDDDLARDIDGLLHKPAGGSKTIPDDR